MNNNKRRRIAKEARRVRGNKGRPHPFGNRASRRSDEGKAARADMLAKQAQALG